MFHQEKVLNNWYKSEGYSYIFSLVFELVSDVENRKQFDPICDMSEENGIVKT